MAVGMVVVVLAPRRRDVDYCSVVSVRALVVLVPVPVPANYVALSTAAMPVPVAVLRVVSVAALIGGVSDTVAVIEWLSMPVPVFVGMLVTVVRVVIVVLAAAVFVLASEMGVLHEGNSESRSWFVVVTRGVERGPKK